MLPARPKFGDRWLFGVCWIGGPGVGTSGGGDGTGGDGSPGSAAATGVGTTGASVGTTGAPAGMGTPAAPAGTPSVGFGSGQGGTDAGSAAPAASPTGSSVSIGGQPGAQGGTTTSGGGPSGRGGGFGGGIGGGAGAGPGAATGGNAGGIGGGGHGGPSLGSVVAQLFGGQQMGTPSQNVSAATLGLGQGGVLGGLNNAAPAGSVDVTSLPSLAQSAATMGQPSAALGTLANQIFGPHNANMGFPAAGLAVGPNGQYGAPTSPGMQIGQATIAPPSATSIFGGMPGPEAFGGGSAAPTGQFGEPSTVGPGSPAAPPGTTLGPPSQIAQQLIANHPDMPFATALALAFHMLGGTSEGEVAPSQNPFGDPNAPSLPGTQDPSLPPGNSITEPGTVSPNSQQRGQPSIVDSLLGVGI